MTTPTIYLVRHGETEANVDNRLNGCRYDTPLTPKGTEQARRVGHLLTNLLVERPVPAFVSSPLGRAQKTASIILDVLGLPERVCGMDDRLREIDFGQWTGLTKGQVEEEHGNEWRARIADVWNVRPPSGENYADVAHRARSWMRDQNGDIVAVAHGVIGRIMRGIVLGLDGPGIRALPEPHDCVFEISGETVKCHEAGSLSGNPS